MANEKHRALCCIFALVAIMHMLSYGCVEGRHVVVQKYLNSKHKSENGDVIDCVDIYKQPAFDHPLIKDLQISFPSLPNFVFHWNKMEPSSSPIRMRMDDSQPELIQDWHKNGECPQGTIPVRRTQNHNLDRTSPFRLHGTQLNHNILQLENGHEYAQVSAYAQVSEVYDGAHASINVWNPKTEIEEFSLSQIWVLANPDSEIDMNVIEAGWIVFPQRYADNQTRFFIHWTRDYYRSTGCYDLDCPGFVQTNFKFAIGSPIAPVSTYNGKPFDITITIYKDKHNGNWWLQLQGITLGYWPGSIFTGLAGGATKVSWGGEIIDGRLGEHHTTTQMGSGHFSFEGYGKSSFFRNLGVISNNSNILRDPDFLEQIVSYPSCYDLHIQPNKHTNFGTYFYYGGPGYSTKCL